MTEKKIENNVVGEVSVVAARGGINPPPNTSTIG